MAQLINNRFRAFDANGDPVSGATLTVYDAGTTTPTAIFKDAALSVACTNPTSGGDVSDAGGWFPQIFAADATVVDVLMKTSGGTTLQQWDDLTVVGAQTGDLTRTVTGSGRFMVTGAGGEVYVRAGNADPDDVGGTMVLEGWEGTQLDTLTLDAATATATGWVKPFGKKVSSVIYTEPTAFTATTTVAIQLSNSPSGVRAWRVRVYDIILSAAGTASLRFSYDGGGTYKSGASDYGYSTVDSYSTPGTASNGATTSGLIGSFGASAGRPAFIEFTVMTPNSGSNDTVYTGVALTVEGSGNVIPETYNFGGYGRGGYGRVTHVQLTFGNTATGLYTVEPLFGTGEA